jgi:hypothetical protein
MTIAFISNSELSDTSSSTSYSVPIPACAAGDFVLMRVAAQAETSDIADLPAVVQ